MGTVFILKGKGKGKGKKKQKKPKTTPQTATPKKTQLAEETDNMLAKLSNVTGTILAKIDDYAAKPVVVESSDSTKVFQQAATTATAANTTATGIDPSPVATPRTTLQPVLAGARPAGK
ncbi:hypothetical protein MBANPS3_012493 [Mucor bainieri]